MTFPQVWVEEKAIELVQIDKSHQSKRNPDKIKGDHLE